MGIEFSTISSVEPLEAATTARVVRTDESMVSDWISILNCLFQIDQPAGGETEPDGEQEPHLAPGTSTSADATFFWIHPHTSGKLALSDEPGRSTETDEIRLVPNPAGGEEVERDSPPPEPVEGHDLTGDDWTILPSPIALPQPDPTVPVNSVAPHPDVPARPVLSTETSQVPFTDALPRVRPQDDQASVEAAFRLSPAMQRPPETNPPNATDPPTFKLENTAQTSAEPAEGKIGDTGMARPQQLNSRDPGAGSQDPQSNSDAQRDVPEAEPETGASPRDAIAFIEKSPFVIPSQPSATSELRQSASRIDTPVAAPASLDGSAYLLAPDKRPSPLNLQLKITPDDLGIPGTGSQAEVRLNLLQRGDELLMKIQGGGEPVVARAEAEWGNLVERLKPHGIEATSRHFPSEFGRRDDEPRTPIAPEQATPDSGTRQEEGQQRSQQEQHDRQQRQLRQRFSERVAARQSPFSLDHNTTSPHGN